MKILQVGDPELIKTILVRDFTNFKSMPLKSGNNVEKKFLFNLSGDEWKRVRSIFVSVITQQKLKMVFELMKVCNKSGSAELLKFSKTSQKFDPTIFWGQYLMDIIAKCCFATDLDAFESPHSIFITHCHNASTFKYPRLFFLETLPQKLLNFLRLPILKQESLSFLSQLIKHIIKSRELNPSLKVNDFIQFLAAPKTNEILDNNSDLRRKFTETELIATCILFIIAGYETVSTLLIYACYELAKNTQIQERLFEEVNQADIDDYQQLMELPYLDAVIKESLRLYPPTPGLWRRSPKCTIGETISLDAGTVIRIPIYSIHRDPDNFENPDIFDPDRFMPPQIDQIKPYTYLPFGDGPKICPSVRFALLNAKLALATLIKQFKIYQIDETPSQPTFKRFNALLIPENFSIGILSRI